MSGCFRHVLFSFLFFVELKKYSVFKVFLKKRNNLNAWQHNVCTFDSDAFYPDTSYLFYKLSKGSGTINKDAVRWIHRLSKKHQPCLKQTHVGRLNAECQASLPRKEQNSRALLETVGPTNDVYWRTLQEKKTYLQVRITPWNAPLYFMWRTKQKLWRYFWAFQLTVSTDLITCFRCDV